ncbi:MAG: thioredoxin family protein [Sphingobacteriaceae bacterium]|nr:thioredoxin family protein [Sphingobacteriaceae bacterium]MBK7819054.1 thioredoxin family protein [Sphingobacteriaceae bacterium]
MKTIALTSTLLIALLVIYGFRTKNVQVKTEEGILFFTGTWQQALDKAKNENKVIFLDAFASWCGPCKMMKHKTFTDKGVADFYNKNFVNVAIDMEKGEGPALAEKYGVDSYPSLIYIKADGKAMGKVVGYHKAKDFLEIGEQARKLSIIK